MITVRIIAQTFEGAQLVETEATNWGDLQPAITNKVGDISNMKAIGKWASGRAVFELSDTPIPNEDFTLFLTPKKVKSGVDMSYKECKAYIKEARENNPGAKTFFGDYTHMSTDAMNKLINKWIAGGGNVPAPTSDKKEEVVERVTEVVESVAKSKESKKCNCLSKGDIRQIVLDILVEFELIDEEEAEEETTCETTEEVKEVDPRKVVSAEEKAELDELRRMRF